MSDSVTNISHLTCILAEEGTGCGFLFERENCTHNPEVAGSNSAPLPGSAGQGPDRQRRSGLFDLRGSVVAAGSAAGTGGTGLSGPGDSAASPAVGRRARLFHTGLVVGVGPLVDRDLPLLTLVAAARAAVNRRPLLVLVCGEPGVGKTALLTEAGELGDGAVDANFHWYAVQNADDGNPDNPYTDAQLSRIAQVLGLTSRAEVRPVRVPGDRLAGPRGLGTHHMGGAAWGAHSCPDAGKRPNHTRSRARAEIARRAMIIPQRGPPDQRF